MTAELLPEQPELALDLPAKPEVGKASAQQREARDSFVEMARVALELGYATSVDDLLDQIAGVRGQRIFNALLAVLQRPHARFLLPKSKWEANWQRRIRPNAQPIVLMIPFGPVQFVFDVSQTEETSASRMLPSDLGNPFSMEHAQESEFALGWLRSNAKHDGVRVSESNHGFRSGGCIWPSEADTHQHVVWHDGRKRSTKVRVRFETLLNSSFSDTEKLRTLTHELGHLYCGHNGALRTDWWPSRTGLPLEQREFEAESIARLVLRRVAPEARLNDHLAQYFKPGDPLPTDGWDVVAHAADRVVEMCQGFSPEKGK